MGFSDINIDDCLNSIVDAAIEKGYLNEGKNIDVDICEIKDEEVTIDAICEVFEDKVKKITESKDIEITETVKVSGKLASENKDSEEADGSEDSTAVEKSSSSEFEVISGTAEPTIQPTSDAVAEPATTQGTSSKKATSQSSTSQAASSKSSTSKSLCPGCKGTGECQACHGGRDACPPCNGTGMQVCPNCDESGMQVYPNTRQCNGGIICNCCQGDKTITCVACGGSGRIKMTLLSHVILEMVQE